MKILVLGLGGAGQRLLHHFRAVLGTEAKFMTARVRGDPYVINADFTLDTTTTVEERFAIQRFASVEDALADAPDIAIIANPTNQHMDSAIQAAAAGCHIFIEKPLGSDLSRLGELVTLLNGRVGYVGYMMRFHPCLQRIHEVLVDEGIGRVLWARLESGSFVPSWHPYEEYSRLYALWRHMGGGVVLTESHELDLATWFFGRPRKVSAAGAKLSDHPGDAEDTASLLLDYGFPVHVNLCFMQQPTSKAIVVQGARGRLQWSGGSSLQIYKPEVGWKRFSDRGFERQELFRKETAHFLRCVRGEDAPLVDISAASDSLSIALEALVQIWGDSP